MDQIAPINSPTRTAVARVSHNAVALRTCRLADAMPTTRRRISSSLSARSRSTLGPPTLDFLTLASGLTAISSRSCANASICFRSASRTLAVRILPAAFWWSSSVSKSALRTSSTATAPTAWKTCRLNCSNTYWPPSTRPVRLPSARERGCRSAVRHSSNSLRTVRRRSRASVAVCSASSLWRCSSISRCRSISVTCWRSASTWARCSRRSTICLSRLKVAHRSAVARAWATVKLALPSPRALNGPIGSRTCPLVPVYRK